MPDHPGTPARAPQVPAIDQAQLHELLTAALGTLKPDPGPTLDEVLAAYEQGHVVKLKPTTRDNYMSCTRALRRTDLPTRRLGEISIKDILDAAGQVTSGPAAASLFGRHVRRVYTWAKRAGLWSGPNPAELAPTYRAPIPNGELDHEELRALLAALRNPKAGACWTRMACQYIAMTGCRSGEALELRLEHVRPARDGGAWVDLQTKAGPQRRVISEAALAIVRACADGRTTGLVFPRSTTLGAGRSELRKTLARACRLANLRRRRVHDLRHTVASLLSARGVGLADVAALLGHTSTRSTLRYLHANRREQRSAIQQLGAALSRVEPAAEVVSDA